MGYLKFGLIIIVAVFFGYYYLEIYQKPVLKSTDNLTANTVQWDTKTDSQPPVTVKITPVELGTDADVWKFKITFDTHSGSLDQDIVQVATLVDDKNNVYKPISWEGAGPGGHHREGVLIFDSIQPAPEYVELRIIDVGGIDERLFRWELI